MGFIDTADRETSENISTAVSNDSKTFGKTVDIIFHDPNYRATLVVLIKT